MQSGLYVVFDTVGEIITSDVFRAKNRKVALLGFNSFCESVKDKQLNPKNYKLFRIGVMNDDDLTIADSEKVEICDGSEVRPKLIDLDVMTSDVEEVTEQKDAIVLDNGEING